MGLERGTLEWHEGADGRWVARVAIPFDTNPVRTKYRRFADVNVFDWVGYRAQRLYKGKVPVQLAPMQYGDTIHWFDSIEAAKLHVEAMFALDND